MGGCGFGWANCLCSVFIFDVSPNSTISCVDPGRYSCCVILDNFQTPFTVLKHTQGLTLNIPFARFVPVLSSNVYTFSIIFADLLHPIPSFSCIGRLESTLLPGRWDVGGVIQELAKYIGGNSWLARTEVARPMEAHVVGKAALFAWTTAWSTIHARQADPNVGPSKWLERWMRCITL